MDPPPAFDPVTGDIVPGGMDGKLKLTVPRYAYIIQGIGVLVLEGWAYFVDAYYSNTELKKTVIGLYGTATAEEKAQAGITFNPLDRDKKWVVLSEYTLYTPEKLEEISSGVS